MNVRSHLGRVRSCAITVLCASAILGATWRADDFTSTLRATDHPAQTLLESLAAGFTLEGPFIHENLAVYVVRGSTRDARAYITLDDGLTARTVAVREKGARAGQDQAEVNTLEIENRSDKWLFLQAGDIVKGGKQDRTIMTDLLLAPRSAPQPIEAFCVERGRWSTTRDGLAFTNNPGIVAGAPLKRAIQSEKNQSRVWEEVAKAEGRAVKVAQAAGHSFAAAGGLSSTGTYNAIAQNTTLSGSRDAYVAALLPHLKKHENAIGLAVAINGKVTSADVYRSAALFQRLSGKLLESVALEALLARDATQPVTAPGKQQLAAFLANPAAALPATETVGESMQRSTRETEGAVMYEYGHVDQPASAKRGIVVVHQSYLKK
jgi:ARG/rhodanese/phosphatase superfamily protein